MTLLVELLLLLLLFGLTPSFGGKHQDGTVLKVFTITPDAPAPPASAHAAPQPARTAPAHPAASPPEKPAAVAPPAVQAPSTIQAPPPAQPPSPTPSPTPPTPVAPAPHQVYGPPAPGPDPTDTAVVGTAPNGEPLYAASWYREPYPDELSGFLSTARPGWALIACRVVPDFRVEDCTGLSESPEGSNMLRAVLAAAWQFKVRPPRHGGKNLWGSWVRIRIDYIEHQSSLGPPRR